jgi:hypothetical protein
MKICFMYIPPKISNLKMKDVLINRTILTLGNQYMIYQYINTLLPILPSFIYGSQNAMKK